MTREDYERRKRKLEADLQEGIELLQSAYRRQVRALDMVWAALTEEDLPAPRPDAEAERRDVPAAPAADAPPMPPRRRPQSLRDEVVQGLSRVPEVFDRNDMCRALGYEPDRGTLYRVLVECLRQGLIQVEETGAGQRTTKYRRLPASPR